MKNLIKATFLSFFLLLHYAGSAQSISGSAYNIFGIGTLNQTGLLQFQSLGGSGIGARSDENVNLKNPASLNAIVGHNQIFDIGVSFSSLSQKSLERSFSTTYGGLNGLNYWVRAGDNLAFAFGASKFSDASFDIIDSKLNSSLGSFDARYIGTGGISQLYFAAGFKISKSLSLGARFNLLSGSQSLTEITHLSQLNFDVTVNEEQNFVKAILDLGVQYDLPIGQNKKLVLGAIYRPKSPINYLHEKTLTNYSDSLIAESSSSSYVPEKLGVGIGFSLPKWQFNIDYEFENWGINQAEQTYSYTDRSLFSVGIEYQKERFSSSYLDRVAFRFGAGIQSNYTVVDQTNYWNQTWSAGLGLPFNRGSLINIGYQYQKMGTQTNNLVLENSHTFSLSFSIKDIWFRKGAYD